MLIANKKRKENIVEYILYLFQVENLIRAFQLDMDLIEKKLVSFYRVDNVVKSEITDWYKNLLVMMEKEGIHEKGHFQFLLNLIVDVNELHIKLIKAETNAAYLQIFRSVAGLLNELKQKNNTAQNDIQLGLDTIYGYLLLKMQNKEITSETEDAVRRLSSWMNVLSKLYKDYESGTLEL
jgi:hypothetical protein